MHQFSAEEIRHIARLARLSVSDEDLKKFPEQLSNILSFVSSLQKVNTKGVATTHHVSEGSSVMRDDRREPTSETERDGLFSDRPDGIRVPFVFQNDD